MIHKQVQDLNIIYGNWRWLCFFSFINIEHDYDDHESDIDQKHFNEININEIETKQLCSVIVAKMDNNPSNECINLITLRLWFVIIYSIIWKMIIKV